MAAENDFSFFGDGSLDIGEPVQSVIYHTTLNTILVSTKEPTVKVVDVTSGSILQSSSLTGKNFFALLF